MQKFDIIINGAGFAGLSIAAGLADLGLSIAIIEPQSIKEIINDNEDRKDFRTTALSYFTKNYFEKIGLWNSLSKKAGAINDIKIFDSDFIRGDSPLKLGFSSKDVEKDIGGNHPMGYIVENCFFKDCLIKFCLEHKNIKFFEKETISHLEQDSSFVQVSLSNVLILKAKLLIAADGRNSVVRNMLGIETNEKDYGQTAITFNLKHDKNHDRIAIERFMPTGPFAVLPMFNLLNSAIVWTVNSDSATHYMKMPEEDFNKEIAKRLKGHLGEFKMITPRAAFPLKLKYAKKYFSGRCVLIADAAHAIHPIAGQGFNQGCKDIALLVDLIKYNLELGLDIADGTMLRKYEKERTIDNKQMIIATDFFTNLFSNDKKTVTLARRIGISAVDKIPQIKKFFIKRAMGA